MAKIVTRYAPAPSGMLSIAGMRALLFNWAYSKKNNGDFWIRSEDSNPEKCSKEFLLDILKGAEWCGLDWIGPKISDVEQNVFHDRYFQSKKQGIYKKFIDSLLKIDKAYKNHDGSILFRMSEKSYQLVDKIYGVINFPPEKDFIIARSNGTVTFFVCNAVDDFLAETTTLVRGNDHVNNFPKFSALYEALKFPTPEIVHLPLILDEQGAKLSKRRSDQNGNISDLRKEGVLPIAMISAVSCLGWSHPEKKELFGLDDLIKHFDFSNCLNTNSRYSYKKLISLNKKLIETMSKEDFHKEVLRYGEDWYPKLTEQLINENRWESFLSIFKGKVKLLKEMFDGCGFLLGFKEPKDEDLTTITEIDSLLEETVKVLKQTQWNISEIQGVFKKIASDKGIKEGKISQPIRLSLTGSLVSPPIHDIMFHLGRDESLSRINRTLDLLWEKKENSII